MNALNKIISWSTVFVFIVLSTLLVITVSCSGSVPSLNDYINGGFEEKDTGSPDPDGWFPNRLPGLNNYAKFEHEAKTVRSGKRSISIAITKSPTGKSAIYNWVRIIDGLKAKDIYELNGWIKTRKITTSPFIEIQFWNKKQDLLIAKVSTLIRYSITGTSDWRNVKTTFTVPETTTRVLIIAGISSSNNAGGKVWFDDIQLKKL
ncbi:MAG: hypothetical protein AB1432_03200 [Bacteroidota bacterium]|jgi:hypothetical protein